METPRVNHLLRFGGIPDTYGIKDGANSVLDIKTGAEVPAVRLQTAAQILLTDETILFRYSLQLKPDGKYKLNTYSVRDIISDRTIFTNALNCYWWKRKNGLLK